MTSREDPLLDCLVTLTRLHGHPLSAEALVAGLPLAGDPLTPTLFVRAAERNGYSARVVKRRLARISNLLLPAVILREDGGACVLVRTERGQAEVVLPETGVGSRTVGVAELEKGYSGYCIFAQPLSRPDDRMGEQERPSSRRLWFWRVLWRFRRYYGEALAAAAISNVLALATALFIMNVYDRVVPNNALETLFVLATGTLIAVGFEFVARSLRGYFLEVAARKADLLLASTLFEQALGITLEARPRSPGAFASQLREFESLRDFFASATLTVLSDLPFILLFLWIISLVGGPLYLVPLAALPLVFVVGLIAQIPLSAIMREHMRESNLRHGLLVEAVEGVETLKTLNAEGRMQARWEEYTALTGRSAARSRLLQASIVNFTMLVQQAVTVVIVIWGVHLIGDGTLSVGALIACVIMSGRGLAPLGQVAGILSRYQQARAAYFMLDGVMRQPVERAPGRSFLHRPDIAGGFDLDQVTFSYPGESVPALDGVTLRIRAGERVAVLGRVGSGKSTLLKLLLGLYAPSSGAIRLDGVDINQYDPADVRRHVGYVAQEARLFYGTLRENVAMGAPHADDAQVLEAARLAGLDDLVARHPLGFDLIVAERGEALSGGQRQAAALARALINEPRALLLDEPTASMDFNAEQKMIARLAEFSAERTLVVVTHKPSVVALAERVVVLEAGRVIADGPRDDVLRALAGQAQQGEPAQRAAGSGQGS